jgi:hypothetical protein
VVIALANNISDFFGIHIFQESEKIETLEIWLSTIFNFLARIIKIAAVVKKALEISGAFSLAI